MLSIGNLFHKRCRCGDILCVVWPYGLKDPNSNWIVCHTSRTLFGSFSFFHLNNKIGHRHFMSAVMALYVFKNIISWHVNLEYVYMRIRESIPIRVLDWLIGIHEQRGKQGSHRHVSDDWIALVIVTHGCKKHRGDAVTTWTELRSLALKHMYDRLFA